MKLLALTSRVSLEQEYQERRDCLDQDWFSFLEQAAYLPLILPNRLSTVQVLLQKLKPSGVILTGGNSLSGYSGNTPERDLVDTFLIKWAQREKVPLLGVCRGMQSIQVAYGQQLSPVDGQIQKQQEILIDGITSQVNSYHQWGTYDSVLALHVWARGLDGIVKAVKHQQKDIWGIMWHPERMNPFNTLDIEFFQEVFG